MSELQFPRNVWVSYASAQQSVVDELAHYFEVKSPKYEIIEKDKNGKDKTTQHSYWNISAYIRNNENSEPAVADTNENIAFKRSSRYLETGEKIQLVVEAIAKSLRQVVVLSPQYLKSKYCLWELCSMLIYNNNQQLIIKSELPSLSALTEQSKLDYYYAEATTLAQALCLTYQEHQHRMPVEFRLKDITPEVFFNACIDDLTANVYELSDTHFTDNIYRASTTVNTESSINNYLSEYKARFNAWKKLRSTKKLLSEMEDDLAGEYHELSVTNLLSYKKNVVDEFVNQVIQTFEYSEKSELLTESIQYLAGLLAVLRINPEWLIEMQDANPTKSFLSFAVPLSTKSEGGNIFDFKLAGLCVQQVPITLKKDSNNLVIGGVEEIEPPPQPMRGIPRDKKDQIIKEIISRVMDIQGDALTNFIKKTDWREQFRTRAHRHNNLTPEGFLSAICFFVQQSNFTDKVNKGWVLLVKEIIDELNIGATQQRLINLGVLELLTKIDDCQIVYRSDGEEDCIQDAVEQLMECL